MSQSATAPKISNAPEHSTAYYFIEGLNELGIEHLFCNFGTDHAPTIEAMAERHKLGEKVPNVMLCPHENTAAHMAMGYAAVTGRGQAVLVCTSTSAPPSPRTRCTTCSARACRCF